MATQTPEQQYSAAGGTLTNGSIPAGFSVVNGKIVNGNTTSAPTSSVANQGKPGYDVFGNVATPLYATPLPTGGGFSMESTPPKEVTSVSSSGVNDQITQNHDTVTGLSLSPRGISPDPNSIARYSDGSPVPAPDDASPMLDENGMSTGMYHSNTTGLNYSVAPNALKSPQEKELADWVSKAKANADASLTATISNIENLYKDLIETQKKVNAGNEAGLGRSMAMAGVQYGVGGWEGEMGAQQSFGLSKVSELINKEQEAIQKAKTAYEIQDEKLLNDSLAIYKETKDAQIKATDDIIKNLRDKQTDAAKALQEQKDKLTEEKNKILTGLDQNTPKSVVDAINNETSVAGMVKAAGSYIKSATGIVGEWMTNNRDRESMGLAPLSFDDYQTIDANRKARIAAAANAAGTDMTTKQQIVFNQIVNQRNKSPLIAANDRAVVLKDLTDAVASDPSNASLQLSFIYGMIQALDTYQSAVREGEINLVEGTQGLGEKIANAPSQIMQGNPLHPDKIQQYVKTARLVTDSITSAANIKNNVFKAQAIINGIGKQWDEFEQTAKELNQTSLGSEQNNKDADADTKLSAYTTAHPEKAEEMAKAEETLKTNLNLEVISPSVFLQYFPEYQ